MQYKNAIMSAYTATRKTKPIFLIPVVFDAATLLAIATSDTLTAQPLQYVSPDVAVDIPDSPEDHEYEPIMMLVAPPYTCAKTSRHSASRGQQQ